MQAGDTGGLWHKDHYQLDACARSTHPSQTKNCGIGCSSVSPTGINWSYVMPQHTGTATVFLYLRSTLGIWHSTCLHEHTSWHPKDVSNAFTFVADPFHRALSSAAWHEVIGRKGQTKWDEVKSFREWLKSYHGNEKALFAFLHGQKRMHSYFPVTSIGRTDSLAADLENFLTALGYSLPVTPLVFNQTHCITSCGSEQKPENQGAEVVGTGSEVTIHNDDEEIEWYDDEARKFVVRLYEDDFRAFNFSTTPSKKRLSHILREREDEKRARQLLQEERLNAAPPPVHGARSSV